MPGADVPVRGRGGWARARDVVDTAPALVLGAAGQVEVWAGLGQHLGGIGNAAPGPRLLESALALGMTAPLVRRRTRPLTVAAVVTAVLAVQVLLVAREVSLVAGLLPLLIVVYSAACHGAPRWRVLALIGALVMQAVFTARIPEERATGEVLFGLFVIVGSFLVGDTVRSRRRSAEQESRALAHQLADARAGRDAWAARVVAEERAGIARELHDVIAHSVSVMGIQATAAGVLIDRDPAAARTAMRAIENQARESVGELQRLLGVLREPGEHAGLEPQPGLGQVDSLLDRLRSTGLPVQLSVEGARMPLPAGVDLAAYRIVQEALTNVLKHAGSVPVRVTIAFEPAAVTVDVHDGGPPLEWALTAGHGLIGMRERVALYGGTLAVQTPAGGGVRVRARIPLGGGSA